MQVLSERTTRNWEIYNLRVKKGLSYAQIGKEYHISKQRAQQIIKSINKKVKTGKHFILRKGVQYR